MEPFHAGAVASFVSVLALQPLDVLKTRIQENQKIATSHSGSTEVANTLLRTVSVQYQQEGIISFWRGTGIH